MNAKSGRPPEMADFANFGMLTLVATPWHQDARESGGTKLHRATRWFVLEEHRIASCAPALVWPVLGVNFRYFWTNVRMG